MKLIYCTECSDVVSLRAEPRTCFCGESAGQYVDEVIISVSGPAIVLGFSNKTFIRALARSQAQYDPRWGQKFDAFVIPPSAITREVKAIYDYSVRQPDQDA